MRAAMIALAAWSVTLAASAGARADVIQVSYEAPGVQNTTATFAYQGVENFNGVATGANETLDSRFGTTGASAYPIAGTYTGLQVNTADQYGGAGGTGRRATMKTATNAAAPITRLADTDVPEPATLGLLGLGAVLVVRLKRDKTLKSVASWTYRTTLN